MIHRFAAFELDEERRELRHEGREVPLQPRVFALLAFLVRHRNRVVSKDEPLDAVWPGTFVADNALQRAVSLARSALRMGGLEQAIRTYFRRGYRFCCDGVTLAEASAGGAPGRRAAEAAFLRGDWPAAADLYAAADAEQTIDEPVALENWATALKYSGRPLESLAPMERALTSYVAAGDRCGAARMCFFLAHVLFEANQTTVARGWLARAKRHLEDLPPGEEHGYVAWLTARFHLAEGRPEEGMAQAMAAQRIGRDLGEPNIEALGLQYEGNARLTLGDMATGAALQDEAAATVLSGGVLPWVGGLVYCGIIWGCRNRGDWERAAQWTDAFTRWCAARGVHSFSGSCRLHRAEVLSVQGRIAEAEAEIEAASRDLSAQARWASGDLYHVLGDLRLSIGELDKAEEAFRRACALGWDPQPGYALLLAEKGDHAAALRSLERTLDDWSWFSGQRRGMVLAHYAAIAAMAGAMDKAKAALAKLEEKPELWTTPSMEAAVARARAEVALREGRRRDAVACLRRAVALCRDIGTPLHLARVRLRLAQVLLEDGDAAAAELEVSAVQAMAADLGLDGLLARCREMWEQPPTAGPRLA